MKNANGMGTVYKLSGRRRRPWAAVITSGYEFRDDRAIQKRKALGYFASKKEAQIALLEYVKNPYDIDLTFRDVFERWAKTKDLSYSAVKSYNKAYERFKPLHDKTFAKLRTSDLMAVIERSDASQNRKAHMHQLLNQMYAYALKYDIVQTDLSKRFSVSLPDVKIERRAFTPEEIERLWKESDKEEAKATLIMIYTGLRINELLSMEIDKEEWLLKGGSKTEAGRDRIVPIREKIKPLMDYNRDINYSRFYAHTRTYLMGMNHKPHDCRVTFATMYKHADPTAVKLIMGHRIDDITKGVYTKYTPEELRNVIESVDY